MGRGVDFILVKGDLFKDDIGNVVVFQDYDDVSDCFFFQLAESHIEFSQTRKEFMLQYYMGIIMEVYSGQAATDLV